MLHMNLKYIYSFTTLSILLSFGINATEWPLPNSKDCSYYQKIENILKCSPQGYNYLPNYGFYYCNEFKKSSKHWSFQAQKWTEGTGQCLQEMLKDNKEKRISPCRQMEEFAFDAHPICYKQYGICKLGVSDILSIISTVRSVDYQTRRSLVQVLNVAFACISELVSLEENATFKRAVDATTLYSEDDRKIVASIFLDAPFNSIKVRKNYFHYALSMMIGGTPQYSSQRKATDVYASQYGILGNAELSDESFFKCSKTVASGVDSSRCDPSVAQKFKSLTANEVKVINDEISPAQMINIVNRLKELSLKR